MQVIYTDGGRKNTEHHGREDFDCTVIALSNATSMTYKQAHGIMKASGREDGCTCWMEDGLDIYKKEGLGTFIEFVMRTPLTCVLREHPEGRFIVRKRGHVFAIVDGIVYEDERHKGLDSVISEDTIIKMWRLIPSEGA